jgi:thiamine pyrophosphate-dependent acetolactate synthase large subunit-like protein
MNETLLEIPWIQSPFRRIPQANATRTVATAAFSGVVDAVARWVPCVAGGNDMPLIEAAYAVGLTPVHPRSEAGAGFMANGIAWESKLPTLCIVITSVGVYGLIQALYAACVNRRPVVVVSGEVSGTGAGSVQAGDGWDGPSVTQATRPFTAWSIDALGPEQAIRGLRRAVLLAQHERLPVHINIPLRVQKELVP